LRIYEINSRVHCRRFDDLSDDELARLSSLGFNSVWMMGAWAISDGARKISKIISEDFEGSPYAVPDYQLNPALGGVRSFRRLVDRAHRAGLSVLVDFVSNHMALDSPWIARDPDLFIRSDSSARDQSIHEYFLHHSGEVIAHGRDPYFDPWYDTAQLDYTSPKLRRRMSRVLGRISRVADGVRCDMAMLVMRDYINRQWYPRADEKWLSRRMPGEFWDDAIGIVKRARPDFVFIAEAYWGKERELLELGFDLAYDKTTYDGLVARNSSMVNERLNRNLVDLQQDLRFIENHDEPRAAATFSRPYNLAGAALVLGLPGSVLVHEGQMEGLKERLPVQRITPMVDEPPDLALRAAYERLLLLTDADLFRHGSFDLFDSGVYGTVSYLRQLGEQAVVYVGQISKAWHRLYASTVDLTAPGRNVGAAERLRVRNVITGESTGVEARDGRFQLELKATGATEEDEFCLLAIESE
jgi:glycosidase